MTLHELEGVVAALGQKKYLAGYLFKFIHAQNGRDVSALSTLSKAFRTQLVEQGFFISQLKVVQSLTDPDGSAKFLFELSDGERIESVVLAEDGRKTLCVSTQVGCAMGCGFCATAGIRLRRSLTAGEIVDQVNTAEEHAGKITGVVYMGMGEPMENYDAVIRSIRILNDPAGKGIGIRHITISTCGVAPGIERLADEGIHPRLAISLNAPTDALRDKLMPINRKYPLATLLEAVRVYESRTGQRVTFEYVLMDKVNDSTAHARLLIKLLHGLMYNVNLIEHNPYQGFEYAASSRDRIQRFAAVLKDAGVETTIRFRMGRGIKAACGQLQAGYTPAKGSKKPADSQ